MTYCDYRTVDQDHEWIRTPESHVTREDIRVAYGALAAARQEAVDASLELAEKRDQLEEEKARLILGGQIVGKNETERDAKARELLQAELRAVRDAQCRLDVAKMNLEQAASTVERIRLLVRLDEMEAYAGGGPHER